MYFQVKLKISEKLNFYFNISEKLNFHYFKDKLNSKLFFIIFFVYINICFNTSNI